MKIEELYATTTNEKSLEIRIQVPDYVLTAGRKQNIRKNVAPKISLGNHISKSLQRSEKRKRDPICNMKIDQLNKHEETSYLLDSETNHAILANVVSKEELCRFLTPLKFIEIDTWRKEVPYGLTNESDSDRRKWRTPLEILCSESTDAKTESLVNAKQNLLQNTNNRRTGSALRTARRQGSLSAPSRNHGTVNTKTSIYGDDEIKTNKIGDARINIRPSTSIDHSALLDSLNGERLLNLRQRSYTSATLRSKPIDTLAATRGYSSLDDVTRNTKQRLPTGLSLLRSNGEISPYRVCSNELAEQSRGNNVSKSNDITVIYNFKKSQQQNSYNNNNTLTTDRKSLIDDVTRNLALPSTVRPRTRGGENITLPSSTMENLSNQRPATRPNNTEGLTTRSNPYMDPNIAYIPQKKLSGSHKVRNYYTAAQNGLPPSTNMQNRVSDAGHVGKEENAVTKQPLKDTKIFNSVTRNYKVKTERPSTTYSSPWVAQTFPDLNTGNKQLDRDGYYVRKPNKTVTFRIGEQRPLPRNPIPTATNGNENISMVVVNVDDSCVDTDQNNNLSYKPRNNRISNSRGLQERTNHFGASLTIPVRQ